MVSNSSFNNYYLGANFKVKYFISLAIWKKSNLMDVI